MKRKIPLIHNLFCWLLLLPAGLSAQQDYPYATDQYDFIDYDLNMLLFPSNKSAIEPLFRRMDQALFEGEGQVNIVHIGGSHIQADMWSDRLRQRLQTAYPGVRGARGLIFPFKMAKTNSPRGYIADYTGDWESCRNVQRKRDCLLGLTGISVTTRDTFSTIRISWRESASPDYEFNRVRVFHEMSPKSFVLRVSNPGINARMRVRKSEGYTEFILDKHQTELQLVIYKTDPGQDRFTLFGIALENQDPGFVYHAIGVNGAATSSYLRCKLFSQHIAAIRPDMVVFSIGINDAHVPSGDFNSATYERNYDTLITWARRANPDCAILLTTNNDSYYKRRYPNRNAEKVRKVMLRLAEKHDAVVWDMYGVMGGLGSIKKWVRAGLANPDKIHMLKGGYELLADLMYNALMQEYDKHLKEVYRLESQNR